MTTLAPLPTSVLYNLGKFDSAGRWYPHEQISDYFNTIRSPSRAWPLSYWRAAKTKKFARWMQANKERLNFQIAGI